MVFQACGAVNVKHHIPAKINNASPLNYMLLDNQGVQKLISSGQKLFYSHNYSVFILQVVSLNSLLFDVKEICDKQH